MLPGVSLTLAITWPPPLGRKQFAMEKERARGSVNPAYGRRFVCAVIYVRITRLLSPARLFIRLFIVSLGRPLLRN